jgi:hypothetical protein
VLELWSEAFARTIDRPGYFEWKYEQNPYLREPLLIVAVHGSGRVVGARGFHGSRWRTRDEDVLIPCAEDFAIAREYQNSGLATTIMRVASASLTERGYRFVMSASAGQVAVLHALASGWQSVGATEPVARLSTRQRAHHRARTVVSHSESLVRVARAVRRMVHRRRRSPFARLDDFEGRTPAAQDAAIVVSRAADSTVLALAAEHPPDDDRISHVRDPAFFDWRYRHPRREYRFLLHETGSRVDGYLAITRDRASDPTTASCHIADWEGSHAVRAELLAFALEHGGFETLGAWAGSLPPQSRELLTRSGFQPAQEALRARGMPCILLKPLEGDGDRSIGGVAALDPSSWDIRYIDSMRG